MRTPEDVEFEESQAVDLDVLLVEGGAGEAFAGGGHDGGALQQGGVGEDHAAGVHGGAAWQGVQALDQVPEPAVPVGVGGDLAQLRQFGERGLRRAGGDVRECLGEAADFVRGQAEGEAGVADRPPDPVGLRHGQGADPLGAEAVQDAPVDVQAPGGLHVDVDVRQGTAAQVQEALHDQTVVERVREGDAEQVHDQAAGAGAAGLHPDPHLPHVVDDLGDRQEVGRPPEGLDDPQLLLQAGAHRGGSVVAVADHRGLAALAQHPGAGARGRADPVLLREVDAADAEVGLRVEAAVVGGAGGGGQQV